MIFGANWLFGKRRSYEAGEIVIVGRFTNYHGLKTGNKAINAVFCHNVRMGDLSEESAKSIRPYTAAEFDMEAFDLSDFFAEV